MKIFREMKGLPQEDEEKKEASLMPEDEEKPQETSDTADSADNCSKEEE